MSEIKTEEVELSPVVSREAADLTFSDAKSGDALLFSGSLKEELETRDAIIKKVRKSRWSC